MTWLIRCGCSSSEATNDQGRSSRCGSTAQKDEGHEFMRCRLAARDVKLGHEGLRDDLYAAMPPLEAKKAFADLAGTRRAIRNGGQFEV